ncbi:MAG TPA: DUF1328 domain-containing protein [Fimbriiglobus sp.]|jgi:uncharacterized membrane protein YtjA (UPF0391 family)|nr:DUF1328 domain-containing protein [Fimbriiglobus sp.]
MLRLALLFLVIALIAMVLGAGNVAGLSMDIAWILFVVFLVLAVISFAANALRGRPVA